jgi:hypothetical protein
MIVEVCRTYGSFMTHLVPTSELVASDEAYIRANFLPGVSVPGYAGPAYVLDDGTEMFPPGHFDLVAGRDDFLRRHGGPDASEDYDAWLTGVYGVCLLEATPENIALKGRLVARIMDALAAPAVSDPVWRDELRADIDALDAIERPFAPLDALRLGAPPSRQRLIEWPRQRWEWLTKSSARNSASAAVS